MLSIDAIVDGILEREGEGTPPYLAKDDHGLRTSWGISERAHPEEWVHGPPSRARARVVYTAQYVAPFDALLVAGVDERLRVALIDDGVMSGVPAAIKRFQHVLEVAMDGVLGPITVQAAQRVSRVAPDVLLTRYVGERIFRASRLVQRRPADLTNLAGWHARILTFLPDWPTGVQV